jgi:very-short-patch-repair endonuclease
MEDICFSDSISRFLKRKSKMQPVKLTTINGVNIYRNFIFNLPYNKRLADNAKQNRKSGVFSEVIFWRNVRAKKFHGLDFDRQRVIGNYIVDFYVKSLGLVVEIDGTSHEGKAFYDGKRQLFLENLGLRVFRIRDIDVKIQIHKVLKELEDYIVGEYGDDS